jgi:hypothetical protein
MKRELKNRILIIGFLIGAAGVFLCALGSRRKAALEQAP